MSVVKLIEKCRDIYKDNYRYFLVGSVARQEKNPKDIDIIIYPSYHKLNFSEWKKVLKTMSGKIGKKRIDAQIVPQFYLVLNNEWQDVDFDKYTFYKGKLKHKVASMINDKNKNKGYTNDMPFIYEEL